MEKPMIWIKNNIEYIIVLILEHFILNFKKKIKFNFLKTKKIISIPNKKKRKKKLHLINISYNKTKKKIH